MYAIHLRKSRTDLEAEARGEGESLARHKKTLMDLAERRGYDVTEIYSEGVVSGDRLSDRPEMQRLLADVALGKYEGVLDMEIARLTRGDAMDQGRILMTFKYSGCKIITPDRTYNPADDFDEDYLQNDMMHSRRELKWQKKRLQRGRDTSAEEGRWQGPAPYGYTKVKIPRDKGYTLEPDPNTAPFVAMAFDMYVSSDAGGSAIADQLNDLGSRTAKGHLWTANAVRQMVNNPVYCGRVTWNKRVSKPTFVGGELKFVRVPNPNATNAEGLHPGLVSEEVFARVQRIRRAHDKTHKHNSAPTRNPLAGLVFCGECGHALVRKDNCGAQGSKYDMLRCTTPDCPTCGTSLALVEEIVLAMVGQWALMPERDVMQEITDASHRAALDTARAHIDKLKAQRARIFEAYEDGAYDTPTFVSRRTAKDAEISSAEAALRQLEKGAPLTRDQLIRKQLPQIRRVLDLYPTMETPQERNRLLKTVISRIVYKKPQRSYRNQDPALHLSLDIFPATPD